LKTGSRVQDPSVRFSPIRDERAAETDTAIEPAVLHQRERQEFGGTIQWEAAFFGLLAAVGLCAMLVAMAIGAMVAVDVIGPHDSASDIVDQVSVGGGAILVAILALAAFTGGYVAARMARFDGWKQGLGIWILVALMAAAVGIAAWIAGGEVDPFKSISLPDNPIDEGPLGQGEVAAAVGVGLGLACLIGGGMLGERFHREVDRVALEPEPVEREVNFTSERDTAKVTAGPATPESAAEPAPETEEETAPA
jgi:hypothetical protein